MIRLLRSLIAVAAVAGAPLQARPAEAFARIRETQSSPPAPVPAMERRANLSVLHVTLAGALLTLAEQSGVSIAFSPSLASKAGNVNCDCLDLSVRGALKNLLSGTEFGFSEQKGQVVIFVQPSSAPASLPDGRGNLVLATSANYASIVEPVSPLVSHAVLETAPTQGSVAGVVVDPQASPVPRAAVTIVGTNLGTHTDDAGRFRLNNVEGAEVTLDVRSIGYRPLTQRVRVGNMDVRVTLLATAVNLERVVVTGTGGERSQREQPAVVEVLDAAKLVASAPVSTMSQILQSRLPSVDVMQGSGTPGAPSRIRIRGEASINLSNGPLVFIDGVRVDSREMRIAPPGSANSSSVDVGGQVTTRMDDVAAEDIQSIEIVKGPAAATLYGADASAGVIQIITKRGTTGALRQQVSAEYDLIKPTYDPPSNWAVCTQAAITTAPLCQGRTVGSLVSDNPLLREGVWGTGMLASVGWSGQGGTELFSYHLSANEQNENGYLPNSNFRRYSARLNFRWSLSPVLSVDASYSTASIYNRLLDDNGSGFAMLGNAMQGTPLTVGLRNNGWQSTRNAAAIEAIKSTIGTSKNTPSVTLHFTPVQSFTNRLTIGGDLVNSNNFRLLPLNSQNWYPGFNQGDVRELLTDYRQVTVDYLANIRNAFHLRGREWSSDLALGAQVIATENNNVWGHGSGLASNSAIALSAAAQTDGGQFSSEERSIGWMGQEELGYEHRFFLQLGLRVDENSSFGENVGAIYLPKAGISWVITDEPFWRGRFPFVNTLRLRTAYGVTGRAPLPGAPASTYRAAPYVTDAGGTQVGLLLNNPGNPNLKPERGREIEIGMDLGMFDQRVGLELTYFNKLTTNLLLSRSLPWSYGYLQDPWDNVGEVLNRGIEAVISLQPIVRPDLSWGVHLQASTLHNEVLDLGSFPPTLGLEKGRPLMGYYSRKILKVDETRNVVVLSNTQRFLGQRLPDYEGSVSSNLTLRRNVHLSAQFDFKKGFLTQNSTQRLRESAGVARETVDTNYLSHVERLRRYGPYIDESGNSLSAQSTSEPWITDGSFVRFREFAITFDLPKRLTLGRAQGVSVTLAGRSLALWTRYQGPDPESISSGTFNAPFGQQDMFNPAQGRSWVFKTNVSF